jgi:hypothetical protein
MSVLSEENCVICIEGFSKGDIITSTPCECEGLYHFKCLHEWYKKKSVCPTCNKEVDISLSESEKEDGVREYEDEGEEDDDLAITVNEILDEYNRSIQYSHHQSYQAPPIYIHEPINQQHQRHQRHRVSERRISRRAQRKERCNELMCNCFATIGGIFGLFVLGRMIFG